MASTVALGYTPSALPRVQVSWSDIHMLHPLIVTIGHTLPPVATRQSASANTRPKRLLPTVQRWITRRGALEHQAHDKDHMDLTTQRLHTSPPKRTCIRGNYPSWHKCGAQSVTHTGSYEDCGAISTAHVSTLRHRLPYANKQAGAVTHLPHLPCLLACDQQCFSCISQLGCRWD